MYMLTNSGAYAGGALLDNYAFVIANGVIETLLLR
ncbi:hypothetical protein [Candidatus Doolittlea endobia]